MTEIVILKILALIIVCFSALDLICDISMSVSSELRKRFINDMQKTDDGVDNFVFNHFSDGIFRHLILVLLFGFILFAPVKKTKTDDGKTRIEMSIGKEDNHEVQ